MMKRKRVRILFFVDEIFKFKGTCNATINAGINDELLDDYCADVEDLRDVEFVEVVKGYKIIDVPNELDINESHIGEILWVSL